MNTKYGEDDTPLESTNKRSFGTVDPDYLSIPDTKKLKSLKEYGEEELCERVIKVIQNEFSTEIVESQIQLEEIDEKILKTQQCLHTIRYLGALQYYAFNKIKGKVSNTSRTCPNKILSENHPIIRLDEHGVEHKNLPIWENLSKKEDFKEGILQSNMCIPNQPESEEIIAQGRVSRYQSKLRVVVGNTYQYLQTGSDPNQELKFKWRVYVRGSPESPNLSNHVASVTYILDKSYEPHDVITIGEHPFTLSRRGWGEFKVKIEINFHDPRNKPVQILHFLTLSRTDDPLALTGIWRLGGETWYDIWLYNKYDQCSEVKLDETPVRDHSEALIETLSANGIVTETVYTDVEGNKILSHDFIKKEPELLQQEIIKNNYNNNNNNLHFSLKNPSKTTIKTTIVKVPPKETIKRTYNRNTVIQLPFRIQPKAIAALNSTKESQVVKQNKIVSNNNSLNNNAKKSKDQWRICVRQTDGTLVYKTVTKEIYEMAVALSDKSINKNQEIKSMKKPNLEKRKEVVTPPPKLISPSQGQHIILKTPPTKIPINTTSVIRVKSNVTHSINSNTPNSSSNSSSPSVIEESLPKLISPSSLPIKSPGNNVRLQFPNGTLSSPDKSLEPKIFRMIDGKKFILNPAGANSKVVSMQKGMTTTPLVINGNKIICKISSPNKNGINKNPSIQTQSRNNVSIISNSQTGLKLKTNSYTLSKGSPIRKLVVSQKNENHKYLDFKALKKGLKDKQLKAAKIRTELRLKKVLNLTKIDEEIARKFLDRVECVRSMCFYCTSAEEVLRIYMKQIPLYGDQTYFQELSHMCVPTSNFFNALPKGRQKAAELWRAREILRTVKDLNIDDSLNLRQLVHWSRRHGYSGITKMTNQDATLGLEPIQEVSRETLSLSNDIFLSPTNLGLGVVSSSSDCVIDVETLQPSVKKEIKAENSQQTNGNLVAVLPEAASGCHLVDLTLSKIRVRLKTEEVFPGIESDASKIILWRAYLSLMEDLIRCSAAAAIEDKHNEKEYFCAPDEPECSSASSIESSTDANPLPPNGIEIQAKHLSMALKNGRPQFEMFSESLLAKKNQSFIKEEKV